MNPSSKPLLVYDGDCGICRAWIERWKGITGPRVDCAPFQEVAERFPEVPAGDFAEAVHLREPDGRWFRGAEAVFRSLAHAPAGAGWFWAYRHLPGFAPASEFAYRQVARHRPLFATLTRWLWGAHLVPAADVFTTWVFLRLVGAVFAIGFISLWTQFQGLAGSSGILPAARYLDAAWQQRGAESLWLVPSLFWLHPSDAFLHALCAAGTLCSLALVVGAAPRIALVGCWAFYLSLVSVGQDFFGFQWDGLLLETALVAILLAPRAWWSRPWRDPAAPRLAVWLARWLLFRLMVASALAKWTSGDLTWRDLTALEYHYFTQPLPTWIAWFAHHLPETMHTLSVIGMFAIEGLVPLLIFAPRRLRFAAAALMIALQLVIMATGNYGFFNLLVIALCVMLFDDAAWPLRARNATRAREPRHAGWGLRAAAAFMVLASLVPLAGAALRTTAWMGPLDTFYRFVSPLRTVNRYGLFAIMTTERPEIVVEGSRDGTTWQPYGFRWKPGDPLRRPAFVAPHMPRLDWQMWFAALGDVRSTPWFLSFARRLLEGSPPVLALLGDTPFPDTPPRYVRAFVYDYRFSDAATRRATSAWWVREQRALYGPVLTLEDGRLAAVPSDAEGNVVAR